MYAIIKTGGKQYKVEEGRFIDVEKLPHKEGDRVLFEDLRMVVDEEGTRVGTPRIEGVQVAGRILGHRKAKKVLVFKMRPKKHYRRKRGHRQWYTRVLIEAIGSERTSEPKTSAVSISDTPEPEKPEKEEAEYGA